VEDNKFYGMYRGIVLDTKDPQGHRRIKVAIPQLTDTAKSDWAWPTEVSNVKTEVPAIGSGVWVMFEGGDPSYPIWVGTFGKPTSGKNINIKNIPDSTSLTGLSGTHIITERTTSGTTEVDLVATILALANKVKTLEAQMLTKANVSHTHP
jgi:hypothetical protein